MSLAYLNLHRHLVLILIFSIAFVVTIAFSQGDIKPWQNIDLIDATGEGGITFVLLMWIVFSLMSRPSGKVTTLLFFGLTLTHLSMLLDFLDEFVNYPASSAWLSTIESLPAPIGMLITSFALYYWFQEQMSINNQLRRTERFYREHSLIDFITGLYSAEYMKQQLKNELNTAKSHRASFSLMMIDIQNFSQFNRDYGYHHGDTLLREVAQLIRMNIREDDLACRYASDRFIVLMPNTQLATGQIIGEQIEQAIAHLAYKFGQSSEAIYTSVTICVKQYRGWHNYRDILTDMNAQLSLSKQADSSQCNERLSA